MAKSWKMEVQTAGDGSDWNSNAVRLNTKEEAEHYAKDLMMRWTRVTDYRVVESDDPVNYEWLTHVGLKPIV